MPFHQLYRRQICPYISCSIIKYALPSIVPSSNMAQLVTSCLTFTSVLANSIFRCYDKITCYHKATVKFSSTPTISFSRKLTSMLVHQKSSRFCIHTVRVIPPVTCTYAVKQPHEICISGQHQYYCPQICQ